MTVKYASVAELRAATGIVSGTIDDATMTAIIERADGNIDAYLSKFDVTGSTTSVQLNDACILLAITKIATYQRMSLQLPSSVSLASGAISISENRDTMWKSIMAQAYGLLDIYVDKERADAGTNRNYAIRVSGGW